MAASWRMHHHLNGENENQAAKMKNWHQQHGSISGVASAAMALKQQQWQQAASS